MRGFVLPNMSFVLLDRPWFPGLSYALLYEKLSIIYYAL
jgi:hypothetical protein